MTQHNFRLLRDQDMLLETAIWWPASVKQTIFSQLFSIFDLGGMTKHFMPGRTRNSEFCFPETLIVPLGKPRGALSVSGKQNSLFPLRPALSAYCLRHILHFFRDSPEQYARFGVLFLYSFLTALSIDQILVTNILSFCCCGMVNQINHI